MGRISAKDFVGTRARFQRLRDAKLFAGWIEDFYGNLVTISTNTNFAVEIGDEFRFEGFGNKVSIVFNAKLQAVGQLDSMAEAKVTSVDGTNVKIVEAKRSKLELSVSSPVRLAASQESLRMQTNEVFVQISESERDYTGFVIDVGQQGIGLVSQFKLNARASVRVVMDTRLGPIEALGQVRYCLPDKDRDGMNRIGIMFTDMDRVHRPRWDRYLSEAA